MNGYGHFVPASSGPSPTGSRSLPSWASLSIALARRGADDGLRARARLARQRAPRARSARACSSRSSPSAAAPGTSTTRTSSTNTSTPTPRRDIQADYERDFKKYENLPQPKVIAVDANIDIFPERRSFDGTGHFDAAEQDRPADRADPHHRSAAVRLQRSLRSPLPSRQSQRRATLLHLRARPAARARRKAQPDLQRRPPDPRLPRRQRAPRACLQRHLLRLRLLSLHRLQHRVSNSTTRAAAAKSTFRLCEEMAHRGDPAALA